MTTKLQREVQMAEYLGEVSKAKFVRIAQSAQERDFSKIVDFLKRKNIKKLFHFTHISNLESILISGIRTRQFLELSNSAFQATDPNRLDRFTESISFSIGEPNRQLLPHKNSTFEHKLVLLEVSANSLLTQNFAAFPSNAASGHFQSEIMNNPDRYVGIRALEGLYLNRDLRNKANLPIDVPTDSQTEILFFEPISPEKIQKIHISSHFPLVMRPTVEKLRLSSTTPVFEVICKCGLFNIWEGPFRRYNIGWEDNGQ